MSDNSKFESVIARLDKAMDGFEAALDKAKQSQPGGEAQIENLLEDRSKLAQQLDEANARAGQLAETKAQMSGRIDAAMANIRTIMEL